jgi:two-component system, NtrC family, nitrogen regulation sensor histidine kinase NtrY
MDQATVDTAEARRRKRERITVVVLFGLLSIFTAVEVHLLRLSAQLPFVNSIFFFGLMNLNIVLIMVMVFLVFRNAVKLILDERRGKLGSRLKTRLVFCFILFAIIPTVLLFAISALYIRSSFDQWFSVRVGGTLQRSIDVVRRYYQNTEQNGSDFARKIAIKIGDPVPSERELAARLQTLRLEYGLDGLEFYSSPFVNRISSLHPDRAVSIPAASLETLQLVFSGKNECKVQNVGTGELVRCGYYLGPAKGALFTDTFIPIALAEQLSEITLTYDDYRTGNPLNYPIKSTYFAILSMVTLLILFAATWTGFYVARRLTGPLEALSHATQEVAHGNLDYVIPTSGSDEMATLIDSFNKMTADLRLNKEQIEATHANLTQINSELSHRRRYIEVLLQSVHSGVISLDERGRISMVNPAAMELLKVGSEQITGRPYWVIIPEQHRAEFADILATLATRHHPVRHELRVRREDGEWVALLVTASALRDEDRNQIGVVAVIDDLTEIQKMERMIAWREVAKRIAHEIKNPLTPIQLSVQRLRRRYLDKINDDGTFGQATEIILNEVAAIKALVNEFSTFARLPEVKAVPDDLAEITLEAVNLFRAAHEKIHFQIDLAEDFPKLKLDRSQLKRLLINLFDNAVAAMAGEGRIEVSTVHDRERGVYRLSVADEGCGITESALTQLFEPYFSTKVEGTGLGLAIVQRIVTDHGGFVRVAANQPRGTRFSIEFPEHLAVTDSPQPRTGSQAEETA